MSCEVQSGTELNQSMVEDIAKKSEISKEADSGPFSIAEKIKKLFAFITLEPLLVCYIVPTVIISVTVLKLNLEKACRLNLNYSETICTEIFSGNQKDNITQTALNEAQIVFADFQTWTVPLQSAIQAIVVLFIGAWSDRTGNRKALILTPIAGEFISTFGLLLTTYHFLEWPLWLTGLIEVLPSACSGGLSVALMGAYSYIADITSVDSLTFRIGVMSIITILSTPIGFFLSGILIKSIGYYGVFGIGAVLYIICFFITLFKVHDVNIKPVANESFTQKIFDFFHPRNVWSTISLLFMTPKRELIQIWLIICAHFVITGPISGEATMQYNYLINIWGMDGVAFGFFSTYSTVMSIAGTTVAVSVFSKYFSLNDALIGVIAAASNVVSSIVYGLAPTKAWLYSGPVFNFFGGTGGIAVRSIGTKIVKADNVGKICSLIGLVESLVPIAYGPLYSQVYALTLETLPGAFYLLGALMTVPAVFIFIVLYVMYTRQQRDVVKNPDAKEMYACENAVTIM